MKLAKRIYFCFRTLTPEDYLFNQREAYCAQKTRNTILKPLPLANQGDIDLVDEVQLIGVTRNPSVDPNQKKRFETDDVRMMVAAGVDLMYLQIDPS